MEAKREGKFTLEVTTTALCDLNCTYCFEGEKVDTKKLNDDLPTIFKRIDSILADEEWFQLYYDSLHLSFWGGEPTLNPDFIIQIMNRYQNHDNVDFHIYTNGFNYKNLNKILDNVDTSKVNIQVSYDGKPINDNYRLTKNKRITSNQVINNLYTLAERDLRVSVKSTLPIDNMEVLLETWHDFKEIQEILWRIDKKINITYSPTIDYVARMSMEEKELATKEFRAQMIGIAKQEMAFFQEHGRYLCSWFGGEENRKHCTAGLNMAAIDQRGNLYACHGAIYSEKKTELQTTTIYDEEFVRKLAEYSRSFAKPVKQVAKECENCVATTCMICPIVSHERSEKEEFFDKWTDKKANNLCSFFQAFGEIDRAVQKYHYSIQYNIANNKETTHAL